jgi:hypothetical protein
MKKRAQKSPITAWWVAFLEGIWACSGLVGAQKRSKMNTHQRVKSTFLSKNDAHQNARLLF